MPIRGEQVPRGPAPLARLLRPGRRHGHSVVGSAPMRLLDAMVVFRSPPERTTKERRSQPPRPEHATGSAKGRRGALRIVTPDGPLRIPTHTPWTATYAAECSIGKSCRCSDHKVVHRFAPDASLTGIQSVIFQVGVCPGVWRRKRGVG
jgi:hypothetical protein